MKNPRVEESDIETSNAVRDFDFDLKFKSGLQPEVSLTRLDEFFLHKKFCIFT